MRDRTEREPIPAGWYQAPGESSLDRYWDGEAWTDRSRPRARAGLQPASPHLIEHDDGRHPVARVLAALGLALLVVALVTWGTGDRSLGALLAAAACLVLGPSTALLREHLAPRASARLGIALGAVLLVAGVAAGVAVTPFGWTTAAAAAVLVIRSVRALRAARRAD